MDAKSRTLPLDKERRGAAFWQAEPSLARSRTEQDEHGHMKRALITGVSGQDGSYLAEYLLERNYDVFGLTRVSVARHRFENLSGVMDHPRLQLLQGDMQDQGSLESAVRKAEPDEVYHLAALSYVPDSWKYPTYAMDVNAGGTVRMLEAVRKFARRARFYQASTSEMYGNIPQSPQNEDTLFAPNSPYGAAKVAAHCTAVSYRKGHGMYVACGILFSHKSPRCGDQFLLKQVPLHAVKVANGLTKEKLKIRNLDSVCDWGWAPEYVPTMHAMLQQLMPEDWVIGQGEGFTVKELLDTAFGAFAGRRLEWRNWVEVVPNSDDVTVVRTNLVADSSKAKAQLGWNPQVRFTELVKRMVRWAEVKLGLRVEPDVPPRVFGAQSRTSR
jgi:GDPmannose 4,6-dehydratase